MTELLQRAEFLTDLIKQGSLHELDSTVYHMALVDIVTHAH